MLNRLKKRSPKQPKQSKMPLHPEMANSTSFLLVEAGDKSRDLFSYYLTTLDIDLKYFSVLFTLAAQGSLSQVELGQHLGIDRAPMVQHIDRMEERELVKRTPNPQDRRVHAIVLTDKGREVLGQALDLARRVEVEVLAPLSAQEQAQLNHLMNRLLASDFASGD